MVIYSIIRQYIKNITIGKIINVNNLSNLSNLSLLKYNKKDNKKDNKNDNKNDNKKDNICLERIKDKHCINCVCSYKNI